MPGGPECPNSILINFDPYMWFAKLYRKKTIWLIMFLLCTGTIILLSLIPYSPEKSVKAQSGFRWDYLEHYLAFFSFGSLYVLWRSNREYRLNSLEFILLLVISAAFSWSMEYAQLYIPGRAFNNRDALFNLAGVLSSLLLVYLLLIRYYLRKRQALSEI